MHAATLHDGQRVVLKIQYPGVARSISSDVDNLMRIISIANVLPKGLYVEQAAKVRPPVTASRAIAAGQAQLLTCPAACSWYQQHSPILGFRTSVPS